MAKIKLAEITVGDRHRKDMGDVAALAESIKARGLLHPPVVTSDDVLVCGFRRVEAAKLLGWDSIEIRRINPDNLLMAERDENELRKEFTASERVAIARAIEDAIGNRQGQRTDQQGKREPRANCPEVPSGKRTADVAAKKAGFENRKTFERAAKVVEQGAPELVEAMDTGAVSVSAAAEVASLPKREQAKVVKQGPKAVKEKAAELRGQSRVNGQLTDDPPDVAKARANGRIPEGAVVEVTEPEAEQGEPEAERTDDTLSDAEWLNTLPVHHGLTGRQQAIFDEDALVYRQLAKARGTFKHHATRVLNAKRRKGEYGHRITRFLGTDHPKHWLVCPSVDNGGCNGTGQVQLIGQCPKCRGRGYWIK